MNTAIVIDTESDADMAQTVAKSEMGEGELIIDKTKSIEILNIPSFINYFKVTEDDEDFFEDIIAQLSSLGTNDDML